MAKKAWFEEWFDSPYYHVLYGHRSESEAAVFIHQIIEALKPPPDATFLDLACGKGRHSKALKDLGFLTHGVDLSENSIKEAKKFEDERLIFAVHDMRKVYLRNSFDYVLNLFTSFGYFERREELLETLWAVNANLKNGGFLLIDYLNTHLVMNDLSRDVDQTVNRSGVHFRISKRLEGNQILKEIHFTIEGQSHQFEERVMAIDLAQFEQLFLETGFALRTIYGDYRLNPYDSRNSDRLILLAQKL
jgi:SAM-dependent methyltransferase